MKHSIFAAVGLALIATPVFSEAQAGPFDKLKKAARKVEKAAETVETVDREVKRAKRTKGRSVVGGVVGAATGGGYVGTTAGSNYPKTASRGSYLGRAPAAPAKYAGMTKCASMGLGNAFVAQDRPYTFQQGLSTEERNGLVERENVSANGCTFPGMGVGDVLYVEVDAAKYDKYKWELQCVSFDGSQQLDHTNAPRTNNYTGQHVMLHDGHSLGYTPTASGSNSDRGRAYDNYLKSRGRAMITFNMPDLHQDKSGTDFYCQHYNKGTGQSLLAFTYRRGPVGRE